MLPQIPTPTASIELISTSSPAIAAVSVDLPLGPAWSTLVVSSSELLGWSLSPRLPHPMERAAEDVSRAEESGEFLGCSVGRLLAFSFQGALRYLSRLSGAQSIRFTLELASPSSVADLEFAFMYPPPFTDAVTTQCFDAFIDGVSDWMTIIPTETFLMRLRIGR